MEMYLENTKKRLETRGDVLKAQAVAKVCKDTNYFQHLFKNLDCSGNMVTFPKQYNS